MPMISSKHRLQGQVSTERLAPLRKLPDTGYGLVALTTAVLFQLEHLNPVTHSPY